MALNFKTYARTEKVSLGTIADICGKGGSYRPASMNNWMDETKRVALVLIKKDGTSDIVICSPEVSKRLRSKELKLSQLMGFEVKENLTKSGEFANIVERPTSANSLPAVAITDEIPTYEPTKTFSHEEMIAF